LRDQGIAVNEIARRLDVDRRTVQGYLSVDGARVSKRKPGRRDELLEAGLAYLACFGTAPTARSWNTTHARRDGAQTYARNLLGWIAQADADADPPAIRRWPSPGSVARTFGSFAEFAKALQREVVRRERAGTPYAPVPLPDDHVSTVSLDATCREQWGPEYPGAVLEHFGGGLLDGRVEAGELAPGAQMAVGSIDGAPIQLPRLEERDGVAVLGSPGVGKSSLLLRIALSDAVSAPGRVTVLESEATLGPRLLAMGVDMVPGPWSEAREDAASPSSPAFAWTGPGETAGARAGAIAVVAEAAAGADRRMSLIVDDADDVLETLAEVAELKLENLAIHAAWMPTGSAVDQRLLLALPTFFAFRVEHYGGAKLVVDRFNELCYEDDETGAPADG
jgi:hypothetical protein